MTDPIGFQRRPYGVACMACRRAKIKCVSTGIEANQCDRCARLQKVCIFESHRRGLRRRDRTLSRLDNQGLPPLAPGGDSNLEGSLGIRYCSDPLRPSFTSLGSQRESPSSLQGERAASSPSGNYAFSDASCTPQSTLTHSEDTHGLSLYAILDPDRVGLAATQNNSQDSKVADPIDLNLISRPSAQCLFEGFFRHFNCLVGLLDPDLYTFSYTRRRSSLLFSSILTISSRIFRPESYLLLREHSETLLGKALLACDSAIENVWTIVCMYYWKDDGDTRGDTLVGFALRMAASADWNKRWRRCAPSRCAISGLPESEIQVRQRRDKDRVWLVLVNIDRISSYLTGRPILLPPLVGELGSRGWLGLDEWTYRLGDAKAVGGFELTKIAQPVYDLIMKSRAHDVACSVDSDKSLFKLAMNEMTDRLTEWGEYWSIVFADFPGSEPWQVPVIHLVRDYMRLSCISMLLHGINAANNHNPLHKDAPEIILICYSSALSVLQQTIQLGRLDVLYYLWDTAHLMTGRAAMMLLQLMKQAKQVPGVSLEDGFEVLAETSTIHSSAATSLGTCHEGLSPDRSQSVNPLNAQARLLSAILFRMKSEFKRQDSRIGAKNDLLSRGSSTQPHTYGSGSTPTYNSGNVFPWNDLAEPLKLDCILSSQPQPQPMESQLTEEMFSFESGATDARFMDPGLVAWDERGIPINSR